MLFKKGLFTEGVFRVTCNIKNQNALKEQLNSGAEVDMEALPVTLLVGLLKVSNTLWCRRSCLCLNTCSCDVSERRLLVMTLFLKH